MNALKGVVAQFKFEDGVIVCIDLCSMAEREYQKFRNLGIREDTPPIVDSELHDQFGQLLPVVF